MPWTSKTALPQATHDCPNPNCIASFRSKKGLSNHFQFHSQCFAVGTQLLSASPSQQSFGDQFVESSDDDSFNNQDNSSVLQEDGDTNLLQAASKRKEIHRTKDNFYPTKLLKILNDAKNAPHSLYSEIWEWAKEAKADDYDFNPERTSRKAQIDYLVKWQKLSHCFPYKVPITFPQDNLQIEVTKFDFTSQLHSLLTDTLLTGSLDQLDVNPDNPFDQYQPPDGLLGPFNSGSWYRKAWKHLCKPSSR